MEVQVNKWMLAKVGEYRKELEKAGVSTSGMDEARYELTEAAKSGIEMTENGILHYAMEAVRSHSPSNIYRHLRRFKNWLDTGKIEWVKGSTPYSRPCKPCGGCIWARKKGCAYKLDTPLDPLPQAPDYSRECSYRQIPGAVKKESPPIRRKKRTEPYDDMYGHKVTYKDSHSAVWR